MKLNDSKRVPLRSGIIELEGSEGYTRYDSARQVIEVLASAETYRWLECGYPRGTFFLAHELGHCILHTEQLIRLAQMPTKQQTAFHRGRSDHKPYEDTEWQANSFSGALLMPAVGLVALEHEHGTLSDDLISDRFGTSLEASGYRRKLFESRRSDLLR